MICHLLVTYTVSQVLGIEGFSHYEKNSLCLNFDNCSTIEEYE